MTFAEKRHNQKSQFSIFLMDQFQDQSRRGSGRRVYDLLRVQIADGSLPAGARAPSTRALAADLGVSRTTVTAVYEQLAAEGFLQTSVGRAARVMGAPAVEKTPSVVSRRRKKGDAALSDFGRRLASMEMPGLPHAAPAAIDFLYGAVASRDFPVLAWRRAYQAELLRQQRSLYYAAPEGDPALIRALQGYLRRVRGLVCDTDQILVVHGSQQGIDLCARLLLNAGDAFVFEEPGYLMARRCFEATGARLLPVPVDAHGLCTDRLPGDGHARLAYVTPSHQFPLGGVLPIGRRMALLQWAEKQSAWIVEDDYDGEYRYGQRPIDALQAVDGDGRVIYMGTFSKTLSPQLRLGYLVLPPELVGVFRQAKRISDRHAPVLEQRVLAALIDSGAYERHVRRSRRANERRRTALLDAVAQHLPANAWVQGSAAGLHAVLWLPFLKSTDETALAAAARAKGVGIYPVSPLFAKSPAARKKCAAGFVLGYAGLTVEQIERGIRTLKDCLPKN